VEGLTAATPVARAACRALAARLTAVHDALEPAVDWGPDPEPVHHLRVATRRAGAAIDLFSDLLPNKARRKAGRALKRLRRAAGAARDTDVFFNGVREWAVNQSPAARPGLNFLLGLAFARRESAQAELVAAIERSRAK